MSETDIRPIEDFQADEDEAGTTWVIKWGERSRQTTLAAIAWYAHNYDDDATVSGQ